MMTAMRHAAQSQALQQCVFQKSNPTHIYRYLGMLHAFDGMGSLGSTTSVHGKDVQLLTSQQSSHGAMGRDVAAHAVK